MDNDVHGRGCVCNACMPPSTAALSGAQNPLQIPDYLKTAARLEEQRIASARVEGKFAEAEQARESILQEAQRLTHGDRQRNYGHPLDDYTRTAALVSALLAHKLKSPITAHEMALVMNCVKLSREINLPKRDNRTDGAGYWWVADAILEETERRKIQNTGQLLAGAVNQA